VVHLTLLAIAWLTLVGVVLSMAMVIRAGKYVPSLEGYAGRRNAGRVSVVVAARDEGPNIEAALASLLAQDYADFEIIAIDDRSSDDTGAILDRMATTDRRLKVLHVRELPAGWLGKNNALHRGAALASGEYLLFTDADIVFARDALSRTMAFLEERRLDHLTLGPEIDSPGLALPLVVNFFSLGFLGYYRPWLAQDPNREEHMGIGAFNLVRTSLYRTFGGHERIALRPDDDIKLGRLVKLARGRQMVAGGRGVIRVRWYSSVGELARGLRKNTFAGMHYSLAVAATAIVANLAVNVWPFIALFLVSGLLWWLNAAIALVLMLMYFSVATVAGQKPWLAIGYPIAGLIFTYIMAVVVWEPLMRGGIEWRGTFYPLAELRKNRV
jgi:glycosyltransferase involved in cell wall biosynthesis